MVVILSEKQAAAELRTTVAVVRDLIATGELERYLLPISDGTVSIWGVIRGDLEDYVSRDCPGLARILAEHAARNGGAEPSTNPEPAAASPAAK